MARQISKGTCIFCHRELSKASMTRHLASCEQRIAMLGESESSQQAKKIKAMQVKLEGVLGPGQTCSYEYDFGSTTELL